MKYLNLSLIALLMLVISACVENTGNGTPPPQQTIKVTVGLAANNRLTSNSITPQAIPHYQNNQQIDFVGFIQVFEGGISSGTEIFFDANGKITSQDNSVALEVTTSSPSVGLELVQGKNYQFTLLGYEVDKLDNPLVYGQSDAIIADANAQPIIKLYTIISKDGIQLERRDGGTPATIEASKIVEYYLTVNASNRPDLFATIADFTAIKYLNSLGTIGRFSDRGAEFKIPLSVLPVCDSVNTDFSVELKGYVSNADNTVVEETFTSPVIPVEILDEDGNGVKDCETVIVGADVVRPDLTVQLAADSTSENIKIVGTVADLHSGVDRIEVYDGVEKLDNAIINFDRGEDRTGIFNFTWELPNNVLNRNLKFVAYDKANNVQEIAGIVVDVASTEKICKGDFVIDGEDTAGDIDRVRGCTVIDGNLAITETNFENPTIGLEALHTVTDYLTISDNIESMSFEGLNNLKSVGGGLQIGGNRNLTSITGFESLESVNSLSINLNWDLVDISEFNSLKFINRTLSITTNPRLKTINAFNELEVIGKGAKAYKGFFTIFGNRALEEINGFNNLTFVGNQIRIWANSEDAPQFTISGFNGIESLNSLWISSNRSLSEINGFSSLISIQDLLEVAENHSLTSLGSLANLTNVEKISLILDNPNLDCNNGGTPKFAPVTSSEGNNIDCADNPNEKVCRGNFTFADDTTRPYNINDLRGCTIVNGSIYSWDDVDNLTDLSLLSSLHTVTRALHISRKDGGKLESLNGLNSLKQVFEGVTIVSNELTDLKGLDSLNYIRGRLGLSVKSLEGIENLDYVGGDLHIIGFEIIKLKNLDGLNPNITILGDRVISKNPEFDCSIYSGSNAPAFFPLTESEGNKVNCPVE